MKKIICFVLAVFVCAVAVGAQDYKIPIIDAEGLEDDQVIDYAGFVKIFGVPDKYEKSEYDPSEGYYEIYYVGKNYFYFRECGHFAEFRLVDKRFAAQTLTVKGDIRVGDKLSKLDDYEYGKPKYVMKLDSGALRYSLFDYAECWFYLTVKDGIITEISYASMN